MPPVGLENMRSPWLFAALLLCVPAPSWAAKPKLPPQEPIVIEKDGKHGVADRAGKVLLPPTHKWIGEFVGGVAPFEIAGPAQAAAAAAPAGGQPAAAAEVTARAGLLNRKGKVQLKPTFEALRDFSEGKAAARQAGQWGYINAAGKMVIAPKFLRANAFHCERAAVEVATEQFAFIDPAGNPVFALTDYATNEIEEFAEDVVVLRPLKEGNAKVIDKAGQVVCEAPARVVKAFSDGLAAFRSEDGRWGFIDHQCKTVIPPTFAFTAGFREGLAPTEQDGRWGFVDKTGKWVVDPIFGEVDALSEGLARVRVGVQYGYCDSAGRTVIAPVYEDAQHVGTRFRNGLALVGKEVDGKLERGWIDKAGNIVWAPWPPPKKEE